MWPQRLETGAWREWTQDDWNRALVERVFGQATQAPGPVRLIDVTPRFLAELVGEPPDEAGAVSRTFQKAYRGRPHQSRSLFDPDRYRLPVPPENTPPFFGQLYLTCLVASLTEETQNQGNFRRRLAIVLGLSPDLDYLSRRGLPKLWEAVADWSRVAFESGRPIRPLILPDPGRETIIGYSKQLAFPNYGDQTRLAEVMADNDLGLDSPERLILRTLGAAEARFSQRFRVEFQAFRRSIARSSGDPRTTLFWAAFAAIAWTTEGAVSGGRTGRAVIALTNGLNDYSLDWLVTREASASDGSWETTSLGVELDAWTHRVACPSGESPGLALADDSTFGQSFRVTHLGRLVAQGCIPFEPGESLPWISTRSLPAAGDGLLLVRRDLKELLVSQLTGSLGSLRVASGSEPGWVRIGPFDTTKVPRDQPQSGAMARFDALGLRRAPSTIRLRNAIRLPDGVLFLKACAPLVVCDEAEVVTLDPVPLRSGQRLLLERGGEGEWHLPAEQIPRVKVPGNANLVAWTDRKPTDRYAVPLVSICTLPVEDRTAQLRGFAKENEMGHLESTQGSALALGIGRARPPFKQWVQSLPSEMQLIPTLPKPSWQPVESVSEAWRELWEACLALSLVRVRGMSWEELLGLIRRGFEGLGDEDVTTRARSLVVNGNLDAFRSLHSASAAFTCLPPRAAYKQGGEVRITGTLGALQWRELADWCRRSRRRAEIAAYGDFKFLGAIRIQEVAEGELPDLVEAVEGQLVTAEAGCPRPESVWGNIDPRIGRGLRYEKAKVWAGPTPGRSTLSMESRRSERAPIRYALTRGRETLWATHSRSWAALTHHLLVQGDGWRMDEQGAILSRSPLPLAFARRALLHGAGVCGHSVDEGVAGHRWCYPLASRESALDWLRPWFAKSEGDHMRPAENRWLEALGQRYGSPMARLRYSWRGG